MTTEESVELRPGDVLEMRLVDVLTRTQIVQYAGASGDYNPLHTDEPFARTVGGSPTVFAHGMLTMGMTGRLLTEWFGAERIVSYSARFVAQVWPGDTLTARATVEAVDSTEDTPRATLALQTTNQRDEVVLSGTAVVRPENHTERSESDVRID
ncbi:MULTISPECIES: MaoC/PaaZ C-terminal domain-containing protein [unclassified Mycobacterium]|uniref:MaoC/PaaZ C-terminal domain-containing protein n=1 Tax=unclassified Mycobacterium TaxID=2642494 RepID=UPI0029C680D2|nr:MULTISPECIES: MaoC/PaaZ C-terminal domain-containing protein [unclassified Mycobacterium]